VGPGRELLVVKSEDGKSYSGKYRYKTLCATVPYRGGVKSWETEYRRPQKGLVPGFSADDPSERGLWKRLENGMGGAIDKRLFQMGGGTTDKGNIVISTTKELR